MRNNTRIALHAGEWKMRPKYIQKINLQKFKARLDRYSNLENRNTQARTVYMHLRLITERPLSQLCLDRQLFSRNQKKNAK